MWHEIFQHCLQRISVQPLPACLTSLTPKSATGGKRMKRLFLIFSLLAVLALSAVPSFATAITVDGSWHQFNFGGVGSFAGACGGGCPPAINPPAVEQTSSAPWTFSGPAVFTVLDLEHSVDRFEVFDSGVSLGLTSLETAGDTCGSDIGCALGDSHYSRGVFNLGAGPHSITIQMVDSPVGNGSAVLQAAPVPTVTTVTTVTAVPEPSTLLLLGVGLGISGIMNRKRGAR
jgi:PEP-CTERM motif-containing protein